VLGQLHGDPKLQANAFLARARDRAPIQLCVLRLKDAVHLHTETDPIIERKSRATQKGNLIATIQPCMFKRIRVPHTAEEDHRIQGFEQRDPPPDIPVPGP
jgi:hypothetical protein